MALIYNRMEQQIHKIVQSKTRPPERVEAYQTSIRILQEENDIPSCCIDNAVVLLKSLKEDIASDVVKVSHESLHFLGIILHSEKIIKSLDDDNLREIIDDLCSLILTSTEKTVCTRSLWCLARQKIPTHICVEKLDKIMELVEQYQDPKQSSSSLELEMVRVINRLVSEIPSGLASRVSWAKRLYLATVHPAPKVREAALIVLTTARPCLLEQRVQLLSTLVPDLKEILVPGLLKLFKEKNELFSLKLWNLLLEILGKTLHQGASLINNLLAIVEKAFKSPITEVKMEAFNSWQQLIKNFGTEMDVLANPKRLRLVMQPLKANNARSEQVACTKFRIWWYLTVSLGPKLASNFETVLCPFFQFCFGLSETVCNQSILSVSNSSINTSRSSDSIMNISTQSSSSATQKFPIIHQLGCEALSHILGHNVDLPVTPPHLTIELLKYQVLDPPPVFLRHAQVIILSVKEAILGIGNGKKNTHMQLYLWHCLIAHIKNNFEVENKKEFSEAFVLFLNVLEDFVKHECNRVSPESVLKLIEASTFLPEKLLHSSAYTVGEISVMNGTPALFMINLMFQSEILTLCTTERFGSTFHKLLFDGLNSTATTLNFIQSVTKSIHSATDEIQHSDTLFTLWSTVAMALLSKVEQTREINQGDVLEHDFSCIYDVLLFPINHLYMKPLLQSSLTVLTRNWTDLCQTLGRFSALINNIEANVWCEELCAKILNNVSQETLNVCLMQENLSSILNVIVSTIDFSSISSLNSAESFNPSNWLTRKHKRLGNVTSFVSLVDKLMIAISNSNVTSAVDTDTIQKKRGICISLNNVADVILTLFTKITLTSLISPLITQLILPMANVFTTATRYESRDMQQDKLAAKLEEMWDVATNIIQHGYTGPFDTEFLNLLSPLLEASLVYPRKPIRVKTRMLWHSTFARSPESLNLPDSFKAVLRTIRPSLVPGYSDDGDEALDDALLHSQENLDASLHEFNRIPPKIKFSFTSDAVGEQEIIKTTQPQKRPATDEMNDQEFVKIMPDLKRKRILTERQKELLTTKKSALPAMYEDLTQDSNAQLPAQFTDSDSQLYSNQPSERNEMEVISEPMELQQSTNSVTIIAEKVVEDAQQVMTDTPSNNSIELLSEMTKSVTSTIDLLSQEAQVNQKGDMNILKKTDDEKLLAAPVLEIKRLSRKEIVHLSHVSEESSENETRSFISEVTNVEITTGNLVKESVENVAGSNSKEHKQLDKPEDQKLKASSEFQINTETKKRVGRKRKKNVKPADEISSSESDANRNTKQDLGKSKVETTVHSPLKTRSKRKSKHTGTKDVLRENTSSLSQDNVGQSPVPKKNAKTARKSFQPVLSPFPLPDFSEFSKSPTKLPKQSKTSPSVKRAAESSDTRIPPESPKNLKKDRWPSLKSDLQAGKKLRDNRESGEFTSPNKNVAVEAKNSNLDCPETKKPNIEELLKYRILNEVQLSKDNEVPLVESSPITSDNSIGDLQEGNLKIDSLTEIQIIPDSQEDTSRKETENDMELSEGLETITTDYAESEGLASSVSLNANELNKIPLIGSEVTVDSEPPLSREDPVTSKDNVIVFVADSAAVYTETVTSEVNVDSVRESIKDIPTSLPSSSDEPAVEIKRIAFYPHKRKKLSVPREGTSSRGDDDTLSFIAHRNTKTYSRDSPRLHSSNQENEPTPPTSVALAINSMPAMSSLPASSPLMQRVGSRAVRMLEAANKHNLSNYEKLKYETKRSPDKSPEHKKLTMCKSTGSLESPDRAQFSLKKPVDSKNSPSVSPSFGILKKSLNEKLFGDASSQINRRRVTFADPLVQGSAGNTERAEWKQSVNRCLDVNKSADIDKKRTSLPLPSTSTSSDSLSVSDMSPITTTAGIDHTATESQEIASVIANESPNHTNIPEILVTEPQSEMMSTEPSEDKIAESDIVTSPVLEAIEESPDENSRITDDTITELPQNDVAMMTGIPEIIVSPFEEIGATAEICAGIDEDKSLFNVLEKTEKFEEASNLTIPVDVQQELETKSDDDNSVMSLSQSESNLRVVPEVQMEVLYPHMDSLIENEIVTAIEKENPEDANVISSTEALLEKVTENASDVDLPRGQKRPLDDEELENEWCNYMSVLQSKLTSENLHKFPASTLVNLQRQLLELVIKVNDVISNKMQESSPN